MNLRSLLAVACISLSFAAPAGAQESLLRMKTGDIKLTILDPDGIRPMAGVDVKVQDARDASRMIQTTTDRAGSCAMTLESGTYGLAIGGKTVALLESAADAETAHLRLVTPRKPLLIGGAEASATNTVQGAEGTTNATPAQVVAEEESQRRGLFYWVGQNGLKTALIIGGAVATGIIIENNNDDGSSTTPPSGGSSETPSTPRRSRPRPPNPDIDPPVST